MQDFVVQEEFRTHIQQDGYDMDTIEEQLRVRKNNIMKTECTIVIAGEYKGGLDRKSVV